MATIYIFRVGSSSLGRVGMESLLQDPFKEDNCNLKVPSVRAMGASSSSSVMSEELPFDLYNVYVEDVSSSVASHHDFVVQRSSSFTHERCIFIHICDVYICVNLKKVKVFFAF